MNIASIDRGADVIKIEIPAEWKNIEVPKTVDDRAIPDFIKNVVEPINLQKGDDLPVSTFIDREDGTFPAGTTAYEKRGIAVNIPEWIPENCTQCNQCAYVCPHSVIRPFLMNEEEVKNAPEGTKMLKAAGKELGIYQFTIQISPLDCTGCGNCEDICPAKVKALIMKPLGTQLKNTGIWDYFDKHVTYKDTVLPKDRNVKNSQFAQPLFEFSGACAGCGETPYIKIITQLFGERMMIANATGCSSIYGGSAPSTPYCTSKKNGYGPAWANSLFEDNSEYGYGMVLGVGKLRERIAIIIKNALQNGNLLPETAGAFELWIEGKDNAEKSVVATRKVLDALPKETNPVKNDLLALKHYMVKKSVWVFGGDGWAYDIGYGGLDHVVASGEDINLLVLDTEVYSNTGGQSSKSTPIAAVAKFAAAGKRVRKKDLGMMAISYGYVYVAQVAIGASQSQFLKAIKEAESYQGPSMIIAYSPCINHGLRAGMGKSQEEAARAVEAGYWTLYRYNPVLEAEGKNPFVIDSKEPDWSKFQEFLAGEVRYTSLKQAFPEEAGELFKAAEAAAKWRHNSYKRLAAMDYSVK
jgi:pyruvate-ferredoxin/flavodoxin oxidoreductase